MILLIDNYDSFVHNLARYLRRLSPAVRVAVCRNDAIDVAEIRRLRPAAVILSPGPCTPREAGCCLEVVRQLHQQLPILGVCLGHQAIGAALGGRVVRADEPVHGRASEITHAGGRLFAGLPRPLTVGRYHSLVLDRHTLPESLEVTAELPDGTVMAVEHRESPLFGVQFHPESILTESGYALLANFCRLAGVDVAHPAPRAADELPHPVPVRPLPQQPVTF